jgi:acetolactate synthase-1/2/3 large subunit
LNIPVIETFMGKGILPDRDSLCLGTIGLRIRDHPMLALEQADVVLAVGYDFVEYAPCFWNPKRDKRIIHVDVTPAEVDAHYIVEVGVLGEPSLSLQHMLTSLRAFDGEWAGRARALILAARKAEFEAPRRWPMRPQDIIQDLRESLSPEDLVICDVGAHKLWMARLFPCEEPNTCIISNGFAAMGIGLPGAIAAKLTMPQRRVVAVTGDGGFLMNAQELETAVRYELPIVVLVWRDDGYGVIRWNQLVRFGRTHAVDFSNPDLVAFAESFGAVGLRVSDPSGLPLRLKEALQCGRPAVIDCPVDYGENLRLTERLGALPTATD